MSLIKILWISDLSETGYANASRILVNSLLENQKKYDIYYFAINHFHNYDKIWELSKNLLPGLRQDRFYTINNDTFEIKNINSSLFKDDSKVRNIHMEQRFGYYDLESVLLKIKPNIVISINDNGALEKHCKIIDYVNKKYELSIKKICYLPIDCYNLPKKFLEKITCDEMWALTKFGKNEMLNTGFKLPIEILPHGIDTNSFYSLKEKRDLLRVKWLPERLRVKFIILNTNKNQIRKRLDITLKVFSNLFDIYPDKVAMILKTGLKPSLNDGGLELMEEIEKLGKEKKDNIFVIDKSLSLKELNELYNLVDVNINTSIGEGWGIIPCEVALCGIPQLVPNNTSYPEIFFKDCLVDTELKLRLEREGKNIINPTGLQCICKGYLKYREEDSEINYIPNLNPGQIDSILLSKKGNDFNPQVNGELGNGIKVKYIFRSWDALEEMLVEKKPLLFQVFCENGERLEVLIEYLKQIDYKNLKKSYQIDSFLINEIENLSVLIREPIVESFVSKIKDLIDNPSRKELLGELCRLAIYNNYRPEIIGKRIEGLIDNFISKHITNDIPIFHNEILEKEEIQEFKEELVEDDNNRIKILENRVKEIEKYLGIGERFKPILKIEENTKNEKIWFNYD